MNMKLTFSFILILFNLSSFGQEARQDSIMHEGPVGMTVDQFNLRLKTTTKPLLVYFTADWCVVCKRQKPVLVEVAQEAGSEAGILSINMENNPLIAEYFEIDALPALILYKDGYMIWNRVGFQEKEKIMEQVRIFMKKKK